MTRFGRSFFLEINLIQIDKRELYLSLVAHLRSAITPPKLNSASLCLFFCVVVSLFFVYCLVSVVSEGSRDKRNSSSKVAIGTNQLHLSSVIIFTSVLTRLENDSCC